MASRTFNPGPRDRQVEPVGRNFVGHVGTRNRGGATTAVRLRADYCIEGEHLTLQQVADRLGVHRTTASDRLRRERAKDGPVTWEGLRA